MYFVFISQKLVIGVLLDRTMLLVMMGRLFISTVVQLQMDKQIKSTVTMLTAPRPAEIDCNCHRAA